MNRFFASAAAAWSCVFALSARDARAEDKPAATVTSTIAVGLTKEELELARYLEVLEDLELLENWDFVELLSVLEDEDER